jgi:hypothetical protein
MPHCPLTTAIVCRGPFVTTVKGARIPPSPQERRSP